jgi:hypothetical protein
VNQDDLYISIDIEADGPIPGPYSMLSLGAAAFYQSRTPIATFEANLQPLVGATQHPETMAWWGKHPKAYAYATLNPQDPALVMKTFSEWLRSLSPLRKPTFVGYPVSYDQMWVHWYMMRFVGEDILGFSGIDIKTLAASILGRPFRQVSKRNMPKKWFEGCPEHTHKALDDAIGQGILFLNMLD